MWVSADIGDLSGLDLDFLAWSRSLINARVVAQSRDDGRPIYVWTVHDEDEMTRMLDMGVDGIITNRPGALRTLLNELNGMSETERVVVLIGRRLREYRSFAAGLGAIAPVSQDNVRQGKQAMALTFMQAGAAETRTSLQALI